MRRKIAVLALIAQQVKIARPHQRIVPSAELDIGHQSNHDSASNAQLENSTMGQVVLVCVTFARQVPTLIPSPPHTVKNVNLESSSR